MMRFLMSYTILKSRARKISCNETGGLLEHRSDFGSMPFLIPQGSHSPEKSGKVREFFGQGKSGKSHGILLAVREKYC